MAHDYEYDVFLSYRRCSGWPEWVSREFLPLFRHYLGEELSREPQIFFDQVEVHTGDDWRLRLAKSHATSRTLVALCSPRYFESEACRLELGLMLRREAQLGHRTIGHPSGLVFPVALHDGERFPDQVRRIQYSDLHDCALLHMVPRSSVAMQLESKVQVLAVEVARVCMCVPGVQAEWAQDIEGDFSTLAAASGKPPFPSLAVEA